MIYVYALTDPGPPPSGAYGFACAPLQICTTRDVAAVWTPVGGAAPAASAEALWQHEAVLEALLPHTAVLPTRFGTVLEDTGALERVLDRNAPVVAAALDRVRGLVEVGVRLRHARDETAVGEPATAGRPVAHSSGEQPSSGRAYLMRRLARDRASTVGQAPDARADAVHEGLAALARAAIRTAPRGGDILVGAYLVAPPEVELLVQRARQLGEAHPQLRVVCSGPWPPHAFVPHLEIEGDRDVADLRP